MRPLRALAGLLALLMLAACGSGSPDAGAPTAAEGDQLAPQIASYDLAVGSQRFMVGLLSRDTELVGGGEVTFKFAYLGTREEETSGEVVAEATASYLAIPAEGGEPDPEIPDQPTILSGTRGNGVYATDASFDRAGYWGVLVEADVEGRGTWTGRSTFEVFDRHRFPWVGEEAPRSENLTMASGDAPRSAIDSRARGGAEVPDPELHQLTVAESIASGKPTLLVVSTPTYCVSRFCGPITNMIQRLAGEYSDRVNFIHTEVWRDFEAREVNRAAADWVLRDDSILEPWVFLIGADGKIAARWDNVATRAEIEPALTALAPS